ncbi:hypothetical protein [Streptomyces sp. NPDC029526]|uniref:hypothetical protein n=1 Tax=Streptomyces sp. NPDC029526 TaxID=3155728 RepID=UPI0033DF497A
MPEHDAISKAADPTALTGAAALTSPTALTSPAVLKSTTALSLAALATVSCAAGLATVLRRRARRGRRGRRGSSAGSARRGFSAGAGQQRTWIPAGLGRRVKGAGPQPPHLPSAGTGRRGKRQSLPTIPRQRQTGPRAEVVTLSPAERAAFAGLVRRLADDDR